MSTEDTKRQIKEVEAKRLRNELRRLKLVERAERANLRKLEAAERAKRTGRINIDALREQITHGLLKGERGVKSSALSQKSYAWRRLLTMLRQPADSPARLEAEGLLRQLHVVYYDGDADSGKGYTRTFYHEPKPIPMTESTGEVKLW